MTEKLAAYNKKRRFDKTAEPEGKEGQNGEAGDLRFVVQRHWARREHFDFRLEWNGALLSWAVPKGPSYNPADKRLAVEVEPHPIEYRNFEGVIPKGEYGGGVVMIWDEGYWQPHGDVDEALRQGSLKFSLSGARLNGKWALVLLRQEEGEAEKNWLLLKEKDAFIHNDDGISQFQTSVRTGRTATEIEKGEGNMLPKNPFDKTDVQLAKLEDKAPQSGDWVYEPKYDGYRIIAYVEGTKAKLLSRNDNDYSLRLKSIADALVHFSKGRAMVLDGEAVIIDEVGKSDFQALQNHMKNPKGDELTYAIFDILALDGDDLRGRPLLERKAILEDLMKDAPQNLYYSRHIEGDGNKYFASACSLRLEGIIGKKIDSIYSGTRNGDWIKLKCYKRQEFVIGGYTLSEKNTEGISSLVLGYYEGKDLIYCGRAGTGFTQRNMKELEKIFSSIKRQTTPFKSVTKSKNNETIFWLKPNFVAEIQFAEWTKEGLLRQPSFLGLRDDKDHFSITKETVSDTYINLNKELDTKQNISSQENKSVVKGIKKPEKENKDTVLGVSISSPDKIVYTNPEVKKIQVIEYYAAVAERMLPFVDNRLISAVRCPRGAAQDCFFKKHPAPNSKYITVFSLDTEQGKEDYYYIQNAEGLVYEAQMGTLEFHVWGSRIETLEKPDIMVFDLDPDEGMELSQVRQGVKDLKSVLDGLSLVSFLKVSGGKGYHIVVPFESFVDWEIFSSFAKSIAEYMQKNWQDRYTSNIRKDRRKGKIFIDWARNGRGATSVAPYSLRARAGAKVALPISWKELDSTTPDGISMSEALSRLQQHDPWKDFFEVKQRLKKTNTGV